MRNKWSKGIPTLAGVYRFRRWDRDFKGIVMIDYKGFAYDLALGILRRCHLKDFKDSDSFEFFPLKVNCDDPIVFDDEPKIIDRVK